MKREFVRALAGAAALVGLGQLCAQRPGGDWTTIGNDAQRSSWVRGDGKISVDTMRKAGFQLVWKLKLKNEPRQLNSLTPPALFDFYIGYRGFRSLHCWAAAPVMSLASMSTWRASSGKRVLERVP